MELIQNNRSFEGEQRIYRFDSRYLKTPTKFGIFLPPQALEGHSCPALFYLAGFLYRRNLCHQGACTTFGGTAWLDFDYT